MDDRWARIPDILTALEDLELPRLSWGVVDGFLSEAEVRGVLEDQVTADLRSGEPGPTADEYLDRLIATGLVHSVADAAQPQYRTRLSEGLRLLRRLRQLWVPRDRNTPGWWRSGALLVSDYRLRVAQRRYPRRDVGVPEVLTRLSRSPNWAPQAEAVVEALVGNRRLARFQVDASESVLEAIPTGRALGRIVTAGTGSGKTLAFYLPALVDIALHRPPAAKTPHTLAIYPRNELLRDQAREALIQCRRANRVLPSGARHIKIGLLYGSTPQDSKALDRAQDNLGWRRTGAKDGWIAPYFPCPTEGCQGDLVWSDRDRSTGRERICCNLCSAVIDHTEIALTRQSMTRACPDILFTTTEMLSRNSTTRLGEVLGWRGNSSIRLVLLDEAHTYSGVHGAQVAFMIRRWRYANGQFGSPPPVFVGLSATLKDAGDYFAGLIGVERSDVEVIGPTESELAQTGREYGLVLRGDPASGAALLSTTIQTVMLGARLLDREPGVFGASAFVFTDDLDVTNRLFDDLRDAEGYFNGRPNAADRLADLRVSGDPQGPARYRDGQSWDVVEQLGRLPGGLRVARTSSQDKGVDAVADVIVATASLEVGFNDPRVGLVVQHKAPRDMASFVQRRGRAGRSLQMRPITAVVLSDYGRDRVLYQSYERLLDPEIDAKSLPIRNRFVEKIQAVHATIDWLYRRLHLDVRGLLAPPRDPTSAGPSAGALLDTLGEVIRDPNLQTSLAEFVQRSLRLNSEEAAALLWDEPRSLLLSVVPTALKRLESGWRMADGSAMPPGGPPLPEFMTGALFEPLNSPDVDFELPPVMAMDTETTMPVVAALRESAPGRVSRRFGFKHASHRTWIAPPAGAAALPLRDMVLAGQNLGEWTADDGSSFLVVRPLRLALTAPPREVADTSSAMPVWRSGFSLSESGQIEMDFPSESPWGSLVDSCGFALHVTGNPLTVQRMMIGSDGELLLTNGTRSSHSTRFAHEGRDAALGFDLEVDAFVVEGQLSRVRGLRLEQFASSPAWRTLAFRTRVAEDKRLETIANYFSRQWLADLYLVAYTRNGLALGGRQEALAAASGGAWRSYVDEYFRVLYRSDDPAGQAALKRADELKQLSRIAVVNDVLDEHARLFADAAPETVTADLLERTVLDTLASAVLAAIHRRVPDAQDSDLVADVVVDHKQGTYRIYLSETELGGLGLLEELQHDYALDPRRFWEVVAGMCGPGEYEVVDSSMRWAVAELADSRSGLAMAVAQYRNAATSAELDQALESIRSVLDESDGPPSHLLMSTFASRALTPGSGLASDQAVACLAREWIETEERLGVEIDARVIAYQGAAGALGTPIAPLNADTAFAALWLRGPHARNTALGDWQPYAQQRLRERLALAPVVADASPVIDVTRADWETDYLTAMVAGRAVRLAADLSRRRELARALRLVSVLPIDAGAMRVYGRLRQVTREGRRLVASVALAEGYQ